MSEVPSREQILAANEATYAAWNAHDAEALAVLFAEDAVIVDVGFPSEVRGREAIRERAELIFAAFPDFQIERVELMIDPSTPGNADTWVVTATHRGEYMGLAPSGRSINVRGATLSWFGDDGLVVRDIQFWDIPALMAQLAPAED